MKQHFIKNSEGTISRVPNPEYYRTKGCCEILSRDDGEELFYKQEKAKISQIRELLDQIRTNSHYLEECEGIVAAENSSKLACEALTILGFPTSSDT